MVTQGHKFDMGKGCSDRRLDKLKAFTVLYIRRAARWHVAHTTAG